MASNYTPEMGTHLRELVQQQIITGSFYGQIENRLRKEGSLQVDDWKLDTRVEGKKEARPTYDQKSLITADTPAGLVFHKMLVLRDFYPEQDTPRILAQMALEANFEDVAYQFLTHLEITQKVAETYADPNYLITTDSRESFGRLFMLLALQIIQNFEQLGDINKFPEALQHPTMDALLRPLEYFKEPDTHPTIASYIPRVKDFFGKVSWLEPVMIKA